MNERATIADLERRLAESEARRRLLTESWAQAEWETDVNGVVVADSPSWRAYTGQTLEEWLSYGWLHAIHPDDRPYAEQQWREAIGARRLVDAEFRLRAVDGGWRWTNVRAAPVLDKQGEIRKWAGMNIDIDARKRAEIALRESEEMFRQFGEASTDVLWIVDAKTRQLEYLSPSFEQVWGEQRETVMPDLSRWAAVLHSEDRARVLTALPRTLAGEPVMQDYRIVRADGAVRYITDVGFPIFDDAGRVVRVGGIAQDLTDRRQAERAMRDGERRQRALIEGVPQLVWRAFDGGQWTWASPQWTAFTGQAEADSHGDGWLKPVHPDDRDHARAVWAGAIERGEFHAEYRIRDATEDRYRWFQTRATPVRDDQDEIIEWLGTSTDVDDLRQLQDRQQLLVAELQHRTRNLLSVVSATADATLRSSDDLDDFGRRFRDRIGALAGVQQLLSSLDVGESVTFDGLIVSELNALGFGDKPDKVSLNGPRGVALRSSTVQIFALAIHELATNALKYGALQQPTGRLSIAWRVEPAGSDGRPWLEVEWQESDVVMPESGSAPQGSGQGRLLIERALPYQLGARTTFVMGPDGVRCSIAVPVSSRTGAGATDDERAPAS